MLKHTNAVRGKSNVYCRIDSCINGHMKRNITENKATFSFETVLAMRYVENNRINI